MNSCKPCLGLLLALCFVLVTLVACDTSGLDSGSSNTGYTNVVDAITHDDDADYVVDQSTIRDVTLDGSTISTSASGASISGSTITISSAGTWRFSGTLADGQIIVDTADEATVQIILNGVDIHCADNAAINVANAQKVVLILADGSTNTLADGSTWVASYTDDDSSAALYSTADLTIYGDTNGTGELAVTGSYADGICSKDGLIIKSGTITVTAVDDGIRGKDYLLLADGTLRVSAGGDGLKSDYGEDSDETDAASEGLGYVSIQGGELDIASAGDGVSAEVNLSVGGSLVTIVSGGGNGASLATDASAKGLKAGGTITLNGASISIDAADDGINTRGNLVCAQDLVLEVKSGADAVQADLDMDLAGGTHTLSAAGDGLYAGGTIRSTSGTWNIVTGGGSSFSASASAKGIKSDTYIDISGGSYTVSSADDSIHSAYNLDISGGVFSLAAHPSTGQGIKFGNGANNGSASISGTNTDITVSSSYEGIGGYQLTISGGTLHVTASNDGLSISAGTTAGGTENDDGSLLTVSGGHTVVTASNGDGVDSNGDITMTGGTLIVNEAKSSMDEPLDFNGSFTMKGGLLVATGSYTSMIKALSTTSTQYSMLGILSASQAANTLVHLEDSAGTDLLTFKPSTAWQCLFFSSPDFGAGTWSLYYGGSTSGTQTDGLYSSAAAGTYSPSGTYTPGTLYKTFTVSSVVTTVGSSSSGTGGPGGR